MNEPSSFINGSTTNCRNPQLNYPPYFPGIMIILLLINQLIYTLKYIVGFTGFTFISALHNGTHTDPLPILLHIVQRKNFQEIFPIHEKSILTSVEIFTLVFTKIFQAARHNF